MTSRKSVLKAIRANVVINSWYNYSEPRKDHQRVKFFGSNANVDDIKAVVTSLGFNDITVEEVTGPTVFRSVVVRFPYVSYN